jgi:hypothetical protein
MTPDACPRCGAENRPGRRSCWTCGQALFALAPDRKRSALRIAVGVMAFMVASLLGTAAAFVCLVMVTCNAAAPTVMTLFVAALLGVGLVLWFGVVMVRGA